MPEGVVRTNLNTTGTSYRDGTLVTEPHEFGTPVTGPHDFGNPVPATDASFDSNPVILPHDFGNEIGGAQQATPTFVPDSGTFETEVFVEIDSLGNDAIYYTTDGSTPTTSSTLYNPVDEVLVTDSLTLKAIAVKAGRSQSAVGTAVYTITQPAGPSFIQSKQAFDGSSASPASTVTFDAPVSTGSSVFVYVSFSGGHESASVPTDDKGNTYTLVTGPNTFFTPAGATSSTYVYYCQVASGHPQTVTVHGNGNANVADPFIVIVEVTTAAIEDSHYAAVTFSGGAGDIDGGSVTTATANDLLLLFASYLDGNGSHVFSAGTGWTLTSQLGDTGFIGGRAAFEQQTAGAVGAYEAFIVCATASGNGGMTTLALKTAVN